MAQPQNESKLEDDNCGLSDEEKFLRKGNVMSFCTKCGFRNEAGDNFCQSCGVSVSTAAAMSAPSFGKPGSVPNDAPKNSSAPIIPPDLISEVSSIKDSILTEIGKQLLNPVFFVIVYIVAMMPTYFLPFVGSNSSVINSLGAATGVGLNPALWFHVGALAILVFVAWLRGQLIKKSWLVALPIAASMFDLLPGLSLIPMVPTMFHMFTIVLGVKDAESK